VVHDAEAAADCPNRVEVAVFARAAATSTANALSSRFFFHL